MDDDENWGIIEMTGVMYQQLESGEKWSEQSLCFTRFCGNAVAVSEVFDDSLRQSVSQAYS